VTDTVPSEGPALAAPPHTIPDTMAQRMLVCTACHGAEGRATPDGYFPRIAGKPVGYLYNQLLHFKAGRRQAVGMTALLDPLTDAYLLEMAQYQPELLLLGSGARLRFVDPALLRPLIEAGIGVETMDTLAAARTYNILAGEGRRVAAALLIEPEARTS